MKKKESKVKQAFKAALSFMRMRGDNRRPTPRIERTKVSLGPLVRVTPGGMHGWFDSNVGLIRKPLKREYL